MQPKEDGPIGEPPRGGSSVVKPKTTALVVEVKLQDIDLFKDVLAAMTLMFDRADADTKAKVLRILEKSGHAILVTRKKTMGKSL